MSVSVCADAAVQHLKCYCLANHSGRAFLGQAASVSVVWLGGSAICIIVSMTMWSDTCNALV